MARLAWWHCYAGIAGDMALGSLVDAGADLDAVEGELAALPVGGWAVDATTVLRGGVAATRVEVHTQESSVVRTYAHIAGLLTEARLAPRVRDRALRTFELLAAAEARLHHRPVAHVHFHEVGGLDAIVDIVGTCIALEVLGIDQMAASPVAQGTGTIRSAHGTLPNPAPAVVALLASAGAPTYGTDQPFELTTPTGAALLAALAGGFGPMPPLVVERTGFGAGTRELEGLPNAVQVVIGTTEPADGGGGQPVHLLEANVDDVTGEVLAHVVTALLAGGAYDAWLTPIIGKKGRPAQIVSALCEPRRVGELRDIIARETGTLGVRSQELQRWVAPRRVDEVDVDGYPVRVKVGPHRVKAEHEDVVRVAAALDRTIADIARLAEERARAGVTPDPARRAHPANGPRSIG
jgi:uncharacterized protein (TIGR00299 family) protein